MTRKEIEKIIMVAIAKGVAHATIIPVMMMILTNLLINGNWGIVSLITYVTFASIVYARSKDKYISKKAFFGTLTALFTMLLIYMMLVIS